MSYTVVFESLQELFPQVDSRILKATSIEHASNLDAAVEFILQDVIPSIPEPVQSSRNGGGNSNLYQASTKDLGDSQNLYNIVNSTLPKRNGSNHQVHVNNGMSQPSSSESRNWDFSVLIGNNRESSRHENLDKYSGQNREDSGHKVTEKKEEVDVSNGLSGQPVCQSEVTTRSTHTVNAEVLEDVVSKAKNSKISLLASVENLTTMLKNVMHLEEKAKITMEEASTAGNNTLSKVEELKQMLLHAKETNDMHAGEVYGERAILSTEARELQSRLLSLSDEKNRSLEIMEEIQQHLEARLAAAEDEIAKAEKVRIEREESTQRALKEQEEMMGAIVEESKKLQKEAEENTKLRDFLMERGRVVDSLQGELAVVCEDVIRLKDIVEGHLPMTKSILSTMPSLSSSTSSASHDKSTISIQRDVTVVNSDEKIIMTESERETRDADGSNPSNSKKMIMRLSMRNRRPPRRRQMITCDEIDKR